MTKLTPMMAQYKKIKAQYPDCILFYRLGDFYEMFFEDAIEAAKILQIALTARHKNTENPVPMCGVPYHAANQYLYKLTKLGKKVAICEQITEAGGKGIVERDVVKIITPGTSFDEKIVNAKENNYLMAVFGVGNFDPQKENGSKNQEKLIGVAYVDITTGEFKTSEFSTLKDLKDLIIKINPSECITDEKILTVLEDFFCKQGIFAFQFDKKIKNSKEFLEGFFEVQSIGIFGIEGKKAANNASAKLVSYLKETQKTDLKHLKKISFINQGDFMPLDAKTLRNLEILRNNYDGKVYGSLVWVLDQTQNPMGSRLLANWLVHPLLGKTKIEKRQGDIQAFFENSLLLRKIREKIGQIYDIERLLGKISVGNGNGRDLLALKNSFDQLPEIKTSLESELPNISKKIQDFDKLRKLIEMAIDENCPTSLTEGGIIKSGYNHEIDELRKIVNEGKNFIKNLQEKAIKETGINSLKIKYNKVFGYYIEVSKANLAAVPEHYIRKQTLVNSERFITPELKEYEEKVLSAGEKLKELEYQVFYQIRIEIIKEILEIQNLCRVLAYLDVVSNLAFIAVKNNYVCPVILNRNEKENSKSKENFGFEIVAGRHPVIEKIMEIGGHNDFIANPCCFDEHSKIQLITGPNMGGKSTFLRQVALIALLAQIGSFVPAEKAQIPIIDQIFTRIGASDNLTRGESTFMVEMQETAYILHQATSNSLIILDEIGRGTSTYDGLSIAWAIINFIHNQLGAKTLFATHYHELIEIVENLQSGKNLSVKVQEKDNKEILFLYQIAEGGINDSFGIEVAKMAGIPEEVVFNSKENLKILENGSPLKPNKENPKTLQTTSTKNLGGQLELFEFGKSISDRQHKALEEFKSLDLNTLTPLEAMNKLSEFQKKIKD